MSIKAPSLVEAARRLGGELQGDQIAAPGPNHSRGDRSLSILFSSDAPGGFLVHSFAGDDPLECRDYVRHKLSFTAPPLSIKMSPAARRKSGSAPSRTAQDLVRWLWSRARDGKGTPAEAYLASRGIHLECWPGTIRFLSANPPEYPWPTLVAAYGLPS